MTLDEGAAFVPSGQMLRIEMRGKPVMGPVEERPFVAGHRVVGVGQRRIPVIAAEHLVGTLARLHHLYALGDLPRQEEKADIVIGHHGLRHGGDGIRQILQHLG